jgi:hypothetical protein
MDAIILLIAFFAILIAVIVSNVKSSISKRNKREYVRNLYFNNLNSVSKPDIQELDINEIKDCGKFTPEERAAEYRRRGKSPSGVIDGVYNDEYRGNGEYNDEYRDWDANA